ncbi:MAG: hypothetical protein DCF19_14795 [Pseudanabaena frigida]|uniref:NAD(P)/FAD-dependent oxidoreductase n=1 Tax=Pseudanabaena frigida TaxID=945775 RepID=A0A2W4XV28_9CYAN|nr:MAG: hypothetical protein DCF19_14795 [Pseudanabaena frigida]
MSVDYDLVVIGMSEHAHQLVRLSAQLKARVAWVCDREVGDTNLNIYEIHNVLRQLKSKLSDRDRFERRRFFAKEIGSILSRFCHDEIFEATALLGVDVVFGKCKFKGKLRNSHILEVVETSLPENSREFSKRRFSSRAYAIAHEIAPPVRKIFGFTGRNYLTGNQLLHLDDLPKSIAVLGNDPHACAIAQAINFLGVHTLLITDSIHILPNFDVAIARTLQAQLEAEGIEIYTKTRISAVSKIERDRSKIWIDDMTLECDRILIPLASSEFYFPDDHHIYQCRSQDDIAAIIQQTLKTSLWSTPSIDKTSSITIVPTAPPLAQIGMTEALARSISDDRPLYILESATENIGLCKIICDRNGQILGASIFGDRAESAIEAIAIAMQGKVKVQDIAVLPELQIPWQWQKLHSDRHQQTKLKDWFTFRRDWNF